MSPKASKDVLPGNAKGSASSHVLVKLVAASVNLRSLGVRERHVLGCPAEVVPQLPDQLELFLRCQLFDVHNSVRHG